jgi:hypothetical protein
MGFKDPEKELEQFLAEQPSWVRKVLRRELPLEGQDAKNCSEALEGDGIFELSALEKKYRAILIRIPTRWRDYREKLKRIALANLPTRQVGRPRKDAFAEEASQLKAAGKSYANVAKELNRKYGPSTTTSDAIRKLLGSRKRERPFNSDKT